MTKGIHLPGTTKDKYGSDYQSHCLEIYKLYVESSDRISNRRQSANSFFLALNSALIASFSYVQTISSFAFAICFAGMIFAWFWCQLIKSYKDMNFAKFKIIHEIEKLLPISPYYGEWEAAGRGEKRELYLPLTVSERYVPLIFFVLYAFMLIFALLNYEP